VQAVCTGTQIKPQHCSVLPTSCVITPHILFRFPRILLLPLAIECLLFSFSSVTLIAFVPVCPVVQEPMEQAGRVFVSASASSRSPAVVGYERTC
jgi:hypothetical protein